MAKYKKLLSIEDLVTFCQQNNIQAFSANDTGYQITLQIPATFSELKTDEERPDLLFGYVKAFHTGKNGNGSYIEKEKAEIARKKLAYCPVLAEIKEFVDENGNVFEDFTSHSMIINEDDSITYVETQVGCFTSDDTYMEYDEKKQRYYVYAKVAIPREYTHAADIIERKNGTVVSVEIAVNKYSYDVKTKTLYLDDFYIQGITLLGISEDKYGNLVKVRPGMEDAEMKLEDFSKENNSVFSKNSNFENKIFTKGEEQLKLKELLEKYNLTEENLQFEYQNMNDEELEAKFVELFGEAEITPSEPITSVEPIISMATESEITPKSVSAPVIEPMADNEPKTVVLDNKCFSIMNKQFSLTLDEVNEKLYDLVNKTYSEVDNTWYGVTVYTDNFVIMHNYCSGTHYKQNFGKTGDEYVLLGDRVKVVAEYLTESEMSALNEMRSNYISLQNKISVYEKKENEEKVNALFDSASYKYISDTQEFEELKKNKDSLSYEEAKEKADAILLEFAKTGKLENIKEKNDVKKVQFSLVNGNNKKTSKYGTLKF